MRKQHYKQKLNDHGFAHIFVILGIAILIAAGGWWMWRSRRINYIKQETATPLSPTTSPKNTPGRETYTNTWKSTNKMFHPNSLEKIPNLTLPEGLEAPQLKLPQKIDGTYFVLFQKSSINIPVSSSIKRSGVLYADPDDEHWKIFYEIEESLKEKNNPYHFWKEKSDYYTVIIDTAGAGSGEGIGKLVRIDPQTTSWEVVNCFYYTPEGFMAHITSSKDPISLSHATKSYQDDQLKYEFSPELNEFILDGRAENKCTGFSLNIYPTNNDQVQ